jgi:8-oxo-dGTP diphosphatase
MFMKLDFYELGAVQDKELTFAVISAFYQGKWIYVKHKARKSWEIPGGHREPGEAINDTANRELFEETGALEVEIVPVCDYSMGHSIEKLFGRLFFAKIIKMGHLPKSEIGEIKLFDKLPETLTYTEIQPLLYEKTLAFLNANGEIFI